MQYLKDFKKDRSSQLKRVQEFVMPSFTLNNNQIEEVPNVSTPPSDLFMDQENSDSYKCMRDLVVSLSDEINAFKKGKAINGSYFFDVLKPSSPAMPTRPQEPLYGMPPGYFAWQTPPPQPA